MTDEEIATKRLSDWKPETNIKLQKALGKFVEESGELTEAICLIRNTYRLNITPDFRSFEDELADCQATVRMILTASAGLINVIDWVDPYKRPRNNIDALDALCNQLGKTLSIVGRCQIQGIKGFDPDTNNPNAKVLHTALSHLLSAVSDTIEEYGDHVDTKRIENRMWAKIDSKLPWVLGTATDLIPDQSSCDHDWEYTGTDPRGSHKGEDAYKCRKCPAREYRMD